MSRAIGMFDSGVGGISVLRDAVRMLPHERFIFYGDNRLPRSCAQISVSRSSAWNRRSSRPIFCAMAGRFSCWPHLRHSIWRSFAI